MKVRRTVKWNASSGTTHVTVSARKAMASSHERYAKRQSGLVACIDEVVDRDLGGRFVERAQTRLIVASKP